MSAHSVILTSHFCRRWHERVNTRDDPGELRQKIVWALEHGWLVDAHAGAHVVRVDGYAVRLRKIGERRWVTLTVVDRAPARLKPRRSRTG